MGELFTSVPRNAVEGVTPFEPTTPTGRLFESDLARCLPDYRVEVTERGGDLLVRLEKRASLPSMKLYAIQGFKLNAAAVEAIGSRRVAPVLADLVQAKVPPPAGVDP